MERKVRNTLVRYSTKNPCMIRCPNCKSALVSLVKIGRIFKHLEYLCDRCGFHNAEESSWEEPEIEKFWRRLFEKDRWHVEW